MKQIPWISSLFQQLITGNELLCSVAVSQVISNVPAALLLSGFTDQAPPSSSAQIWEAWEH